MLKSSINTEIRNETGSNESNRIRNSGHIPGILYGHGINPKTIEVDKRELSGILRDYGTSVLLELEVDGKTMTSMIKEIQREPIRNEIIHVDFQTVSYNKPIHAMVPVKLVDKDSTKTMEGTVQHQLRELSIECLPQNIPQSVEISIKDLAFGQPLTIGDVEFSKEINVLNNVSEVIASLAHVEKIIDDEGEKENLLDQLTDI